MSSLFYPLLTFALLTLVISYWAITAVYPKENNYKYTKALLISIVHCFLNTVITPNT